MATPTKSVTDVLIQECGLGRIPVEIQNIDKVKLAEYKRAVNKGCVCGGKIEVIFKHGTVSAFCNECNTLQIKITSLVSSILNSSRVLL